VIRLPTAAVTALRDRLRERGARPSISVPIVRDASAEDVLDSLLADQYAPFCDAMYLMMAADGQLEAAERDVIRGALRELDDRIRSRHIDAMLTASAEALVRDGWEARLAALGEALAEDTTRAEAAILLAAAVAYADGTIAPAEIGVMNALLKTLGVEEARLHHLVGSLERVDTALEADAQSDAADVVLHASMRLRAPEDFERLAAAPDRPDASLLLRLYAHYVRTCDDLLDRAAHPRSIPTASVSALGELASGLQQGRSPRLDELRETLASLVAALASVDRASSLRALAADEALDDAERALQRLSTLTLRAHERLGGAPAPLGRPRSLREAAARAAREEQASRVSLGEAIDAWLAWGGASIPSAVLSTVGRVLGELRELPVDDASAAPPPPSVAELPDWIPASRVLGGFHLVRALGGGGSGSVFVVVRADEREDPDAPRYALKVPHYDAVAARSISEAEYLRVFKLEAGALLALPDHPNLAGFVTFDARARPKPLLVMELVEGTDCHALLERKALSAARVHAILDGVLAGLEAMHEAEVGHLDLKPGNIVLRGERDAVLVDFGLTGRHLRVGCATPSYASPEVWGHTEPGVTMTPMAADVYSFACVAFELMTGALLFAGDHMLAVMSAHFDHDGRPAGLERLARAGYGSIADWLSPCLRRSAPERPTVTTLRAGLRGLAPLFEQARWPLGVA
jgi:tellurite resistance protein